jgi:hypothetical protein
MVCVDGVFQRSPYQKAGGTHDISFQLAVPVGFPKDVIFPALC